MKYFIPFYFILPLVKGEFDDAPLITINLMGTLILLLYIILFLTNYK
jgi:hypothetical protein